MNNFKLCINVGNSAVSGALFNGERIVSAQSLAHGKFLKWISQIKRRRSSEVHDEICDCGPGCCIPQVLLASVVPAMTRKIVKELHRKGIACSVVTPKTIKGLRFHYKNLAKLGVDRALNAYGAKCLLGTDAVIADFGTALTVDYVSKKGVFEGGFILPGLETSLGSLKARTALLPKVKLKGRVSLPGRSTDECIRGGILLGYSALTRAFYEELKKKYRSKKCALVITGGHAGTIRPYLRDIKGLHHDPLFTLKSLNLI